MKRRQDRFRQKLSKVIPILTLYAYNGKAPKEIAREIGRSAYWVRKQIRIFRRCL